MEKQRRANGEGSWSRKNINGYEYFVYSKSYSTGRHQFYGSNKKDALDKCKKYELEKREIISKDIQKLDFYTYSSMWLFNWKSEKIKSKTKDSYYICIETKIKNSKLGNLQISYINKMSNEIFSDIVNKFLFDIAAKYSLSYVTLAKNVLYQIISYGITKKDIVPTAFPIFATITEDNVKSKIKKQTVLNYKQIEILWETYKSCDNYTNKDSNSAYGICYSVYVFICYTGLRYGEVSGLKWKNVNIEKGYINIVEQSVFHYDYDNDKRQRVKKVVENGSPKSKTSIRTIPLHKRALEVLLNMKKIYPQNVKANNFVFSYNGKDPVTNGVLNYQLKLLCKTLNFPEISVHKLRSSFASVIINEDSEKALSVSKLLGHSSIDITLKKYYKISDEKSRKAISILDKIGNFASNNIENVNSDKVKISYSTSTNPFLRGLKK